MKQVLLVDGYNMIGAWPELRKLADDSLEDARDRLLDMLANYRGYSGKAVVVVFDAHQVPGPGSRYRQGGVDVIFTNEKETADEVIERMAGELSGRGTVIQVATSDSAEQHVAFGRGALRMSARELLIQVREAEEQIRRRLDEPPPRRASLDEALSEEMRLLLEKWRRGR